MICCTVSLKGITTEAKRGLGESHEEIVRVLLKAGADEDRISYRGTPLTWAAYNYGQEEVVQLLLDARADKNRCDEDGYTALTAAVSQGHLDVACLLLDARADAEILCPSQKTPLCVACCAGDLDMVHMLLSAGVNRDSISLKGTPLTWAASEACAMWEYFRSPGRNNSVWTTIPSSGA